MLKLDGMVMSGGCSEMETLMGACTPVQPLWRTFDSTYYKLNHVFPMAKPFYFLVTREAFACV